MSSLCNKFVQTPRSIKLRSLLERTKKTHTETRSRYTVDLLRYRYPLARARERRRVRHLCYRRARARALFAPRAWRVGPGSSRWEQPGLRGQRVWRADISKATDEGSSAVYNGRIHSRTNDDCGFTPVRAARCRCQYRY
eukprot:COSAG02_NODE_876_length_16272_cov_138.802510_8_plen_139_part_00